MPPILRPVELSLVPDSVGSFGEAATAMRHCSHLCTLLDNQRGLIRNTYCLRVALIRHLFTRVMPLPLPHGHPRRRQQCFWAADCRPMRYETQADLLRMLDQVRPSLVGKGRTIGWVGSSDLGSRWRSGCFGCCHWAIMWSVVCCEAD